MHVQDSWVLLSMVLESHKHCQSSSGGSLAPNSTVSQVPSITLWDLQCYLSIARCDTRYTQSQEGILVCHNYTNAHGFRETEIDVSKSHASTGEPQICLRANPEYSGGLRINKHEKLKLEANWQSAKLRERECILTITKKNILWKWFTFTLKNKKNQNGLYFSGISKYEASLKRCKKAKKWFSKRTSRVGRTRWWNAETTDPGEGWVR